MVVLCYHCRYYFFDSSKSPFFEICYIVTGGQAFPAVLAWTTVDFLFFGMTLYICAFYDELIHVTQAIGLKDAGHLVPSWRFKQLRKCVQFHINILELV